MSAERMRLCRFRLVSRRECATVCGCDVPCAVPSLRAVIFRVGAVSGRFCISPNRRGSTRETKTESEARLREGMKEERKRETASKAHAQ